GFYFVPSLPFFAIGFAVFIADTIGLWINRIDITKILYKSFSILSLCLLTGVFIFTFFQIGKTSRHKKELHDIYLAGTVIPKFSVVGGEWEDWSLQTYLMRYFSISLEPDFENLYYIIDKSAPTEKLTGYKKI